ncbi:MAG TPA: DinB family protein [Gemmatimonadales bacterium]|nr:DinB family protein [Gemmatimonadales bacterium]
MYRRISDFLADWKDESKSTKDVLEALTDESLNQRVTPTGRSLSKLGWHIAQSLHMVTEAGLEGLEAPREHDAIPTSARAILQAYENAANSLAKVVGKGWTDAQLAEEVPMYGESWARGKVLSVIIRHEAHHRGQMTVLMRQAGVIVPGPYGPAREQWVTYGMEPQD